MRYLLFACLAFAVLFVHSQNSPATETPQPKKSKAVRAQYGRIFLSAEAVYSRTRVSKSFGDGYTGRQEIRISNSGRLDPALAFGFQNFGSRVGMVRLEGGIGMSGFAGDVSSIVNTNMPERHVFDSRMNEYQLFFRPQYLFWIGKDHHVYAGAGPRLSLTVLAHGKMETSSYYYPNHAFHSSASGNLTAYVDLTKFGFVFTTGTMIDLKYQGLCFVEVHACLNMGPVFSDPALGAYRRNSVSVGFGWMIN